MSNNKQSMKLYTEEQIKNAYTRIWADGGHDKYSLSGLEEMLEQLTPIELPTDEEIEEMGKDVIVYNDTKRGWFIEGLKFMRSKIQGGNK